MIKRIEPVILFVRNFQESLVFYRDKLGLQPYPGSWGTGHGGGFAQFRVGGSTFAIHGGYKGPAGGPIAIHFEVDDLSAEAARLRSLGVEVGEVTDQPWGREMVVVDPNGYEVELVEYTASSL